MDVGDDREGASGADALEAVQGVGIGNRHADDLRAGELTGLDLLQNRRRIGCGGFGHALEREGRATADGHAADRHLAGEAAGPGGREGGIVV